MNYDLYGPVRNAFDAGKSITRASGRGLGPGNQDFFKFFGPCEMASSRYVHKGTLRYKEYLSIVLLDLLKTLFDTVLLLYF